MSRFIGYLWHAEPLSIGGGVLTQDKEKFRLLDFVDEGDPFDSYYIGQREDGSEVQIPQHIVDNYGRTSR